MTRPPRMQHVLAALPTHHAAYLTGRSFFPNLIWQPFSHDLTVAFGFATVACLVAALASLLRGGKYVHIEAATGDREDTP